jgi:DNA-binding Xre family transcriptional regulator
MDIIICEEVTKMAVSYKRLWKLLIDRDMKKKDLQAAAGISPSSIAKLSKNENVSMDVLIKVCTALNVGFEDIMELVSDTIDEK